MRHPRVVRNHIKKFAATLQCADELRPLPFQDANDRSRIGSVALRPQANRLHIAPDQHTVAVEGRCGGALWNHNLPEGRIVWPEEAFALAVDLDGPGDKIGRIRKNVTIAFGAGDLARALQFTQTLLQFLLLIRAQAQSPQQLRNIARRVIFTAE